MTPSSSIPSPNVAPVRRPAAAWPWTPDSGDGFYSNPVLYADYSDPDVIRHGEDFYLIASSFNCTPGLPILHSRDLVNWTILNHALKNVPDSRYRQVQHGGGVWAPAIRFHAGKFWIFFPTPDEGIYVVTADHPAADWSEPHLLQAGKGLIDPCPLWDEDGQAYLVHAYAKSRAGFRDVLRVRPMAADASRLLGEGQIVFQDPAKHPVIEGPKFMKRGGWYYILAPAGGVQTGWQVALRSRNIFGPYEDKVVLEQGGTPINGPHQGALVDTPAGEWWFLHFQDAGVCGRLTHLQPVTWQDDWPLMGRDHDGNGIGEPVARFRKPQIAANSRSVIPQTSDEFDSAALGLQWQWHANHEKQWHSLTARPGWLRLYSHRVANADLFNTPNLLLQKLPAKSFAVETKLEFLPQAEGEEAGLVVMGNSCASLALRKTAEETQILFRENGKETFIQNVSSPAVVLRLNFAEGGECEFSFGTDRGALRRIPHGFTASPGQWIGAKVGLYALRTSAAPAGHADFDFFRFSN